jgi:hypothetical protein
MSAESPALLGRTIAYCAECRRSHPARYEDDCGKVVYAIDCPHEPKKTVVSSNPGLFAALRSFEDVSPTVAFTLRKQRSVYWDLGGPG